MFFPFFFSFLYDMSFIFSCSSESCGWNSSISLWTSYFSSASPSSYSSKLKSNSSSHSSSSSISSLNFSK